ncbi:DUF4376 domain-containing protein [Rhizobium ruizarguesonis]|uniref:DUF4376 domain-containing protein n=1 Tax=Rhizobium ruizarguesonis TaxID=2081791 RepID=UPI001032711A|nr:hypothetical protein [Rhizobium ruizarguesonis]TAY95872.1 hypothetical protein ELH85_23010 [Rhizobium ruizarguesonis]
MADFLRVQDGVAVEAWSEPEGFAIDDCFTPEFAETFHPRGSADIGWIWNGSQFSSPAGPSLDELKATKIAAINIQTEEVLAAGAPADGLHIALDADSRADMGAMATTAALALSGATEWPDSYSRGWISIENIRIPLDVPADGIALAAGVGDYYARVRQNSRDLKDGALAAGTEEELNAVEIDSGWPDAA